MNQILLPGGNVSERALAGARPEELAERFRSGPLAQAAALGLAVGLLYDLFRVLRVRVALPLLGAVLDLSFWIIVTVALFVWSQQASGCTGSSFSLGAGCSISGSSVPGC